MPNASSPPASPPLCKTFKFTCARQSVNGRQTKKRPWKSNLYSKTCPPFLRSPAPFNVPSARGHTKGSSGRARAHTAVQGISPREILLHNIITLPAPVFLSITRVGAAGFKMVKLIGQAQHLPPDGGGVERSFGSTKARRAYSAAIAHRSPDGKTLDVLATGRNKRALTQPLAATFFRVGSVENFDN